MTLSTIVLGGGCFWCTESVYKEVRGVSDVESGYSNGQVPQPSYEDVCTGTTGCNEVVRLVYDPSRVSTRELLEIFFVIHDPTTLNRQGNDRGLSYRSGIYYLYRDLGLPVTPVATSVGLLWNRRDWRKKPGRAAVEFLPAIETGLDKESFMRRLEDTIESASDRLIAEFSGRPYRPSQLVLRSQGQTGIGAPITAPRGAP